MEPRKMVLRKPFAGQQWRHRHREQGRERWTYGESNMETYTLSYVKQPMRVHSVTRNLKWGSVTTYRGGMGGRQKGGSRGR